MAALLNVRHERFCLELVRGQSAAQAYASAGYKYHDGNCIRLKGNERVKARILELQQQMAAKHEVTTDSLMAEAAALMREARDAGQFAAATGALKELGILSGKRIERSEQGKPHEFAAMSTDALMRELEMLGIRVVQTPTIEGEAEDVTQ